MKEKGWSWVAKAHNTHKTRTEDGKKICLKTWKKFSTKKISY
jgi:hypothetical protein